MNKKIVIALLLSAGVTTGVTAVITTLVVRYKNSVTSPPQQDYSASQLSQFGASYSDPDGGLHAGPLSDPEFVNAIDTGDIVVNKLHTALTKLAFDGSMQDLVKFLDAHACYAMRIHGGFALRECHRPKDDPYAFDIVFVPEEIAGSFPLVHYRKEGGRSYLYVVAEFTSVEWVALSMLVELSVLRRDIISSRVDATPHRETPFIRETIMYREACRIIEHWKPAGYYGLMKVRPSPWGARGVPLNNLFTFFPELRTLNQREVDSAGLYLIACAMYGTAKETGRNPTEVARRLAEDANVK